jgi:ketosteroid isomerase-like protein
MPSITAEQRDSVLAADDAFFAALRTADTATLAGLLDPEFLLVDIASGGVVSGDQLAALLAAGQLVVEELTPFHDEAVVRGFGTTAIVVGRTAMRVRLADGGQVELASRYTHVFVPAEPGRWHLASAQGTRIGVG